VLTVRPISANHRKNFSSTPMLMPGFGVLKAQLEIARLKREGSQNPT
jgi:hypothetical protein